MRRSCSLHPIVFVYDAITSKPPHLWSHVVELSTTSSLLPRQFQLVVGSKFRMSIYLYKSVHEILSVFFNWRNSHRVFQQLGYLPM